MCFSNLLKFGISLISMVCSLLLVVNYALSGQPGEQCPDPGLEYETGTGENYWEWFARGEVLGLIQGDKYICTKYSGQSEHGLYSVNLLIPKLEFEDRQKNRVGLTKGISTLFAIYGYPVTNKKKEVRPGVYDDLSAEFAFRMEMITGLKFKTAKEWVDWWKLSKDRLVLSEDGKHLIVKK